MMAVTSPCIRHCCLNDEDICVGCFRSLDEIKNWTAVDDVVQKKICVNAKMRQEAYRQRFPGWIPPKPK